MFHNAANIAELFTFNSCQNLINNQTKFNIEPVSSCVDRCDSFIDMYNNKKQVCPFSNPRYKVGTAMCVF